MEILEDDEIVEEFDVFLNKDFENIWLLQFPLRPQHFPYDLNKITDVRVKPLQFAVEMDIANGNLEDYDFGLKNSIYVFNV
jgi:hypothetical protein